MKQVLNASRKVFLHDLDGVHYSYELFGNVYEFCADVKSEVVPKLLPGLTKEDAKKIGKESYLQTGDGLHLFIEMARDRGHDVDEFRDRLHADYHKLQLERVRNLVPQVLEPCDRTIDLFKQLSPSVRHGMITQSCRVEWASPILSAKKHIGFFEQDSVFGFREFGWQRKAASTFALSALMKHMDARPEQSVFIEDNLDNLKKAKELSGDLLTVFLCHSKPQNPVPAYVDVQVPTLRDFFDLAASAHAAPAIKPRSVAATAQALAL